MGDAFERWTWKDWIENYDAKVGAYHLGVCLIEETVTQGYFVEPLNAPAFYEFIKMCETNHIFPQINWKRYSRKLKEERVMFYQALHRDVSDTTIKLGASEDFYKSAAYHRWLLHTFPWEKVEEVDEKEALTDILSKTECALYYSGKAKLLDLLKRRVDIEWSEIDFDDEKIYDVFRKASLNEGNQNVISSEESMLGICGIPGLGTKELVGIMKRWSAPKCFDDLVDICNQLLKELGSNQITRMAQSIYEASLAYLMAWFLSYHREIFCECYQKAIVETRNNYFLGHYYKMPSPTYLYWEERLLTNQL